ncbi:MAG: hypothetical protein JXQ96_16660 [Cyclobacteriaceae bacterium]
MRRNKIQSTHECTSSLFLNVWSNGIRRYSYACPAIHYIPRRYRLGDAASIGANNQERIAPETLSYIIINKKILAMGIIRQKI